MDKQSHKKAVLECIGYSRKLLITIIMRKITYHGYTICDDKYSLLLWLQKEIISAKYQELSWPQRRTILHVTGERETHKWLPLFDEESTRGRKLTDTARFIGPGILTEKHNAGNVSLFWKPAPHQSETEEYKVILYPYSYKCQYMMPSKSND